MSFAGQIAPVNPPFRLAEDAVPFFDTGFLS